MENINNLYTDTYFNWLQSKKNEMHHFTDHPPAMVFGAMTGAILAGFGACYHLSEATRHLCCEAKCISCQWLGCAEKDQDAQLEQMRSEIMKAMVVALEMLIVPFLCLTGMIGKALALHEYLKSLCQTKNLGQLVFEMDTSQEELPIVVITPAVEEEKGKEYHREADLPEASKIQEVPVPEIEEFVMKLIEESGHLPEMLQAAPIVANPRKGALSVDESELASIVSYLHNRIDIVHAHKDKLRPQLSSSFQNLGLFLENVESEMQMQKRLAHGLKLANALKSGDPAVVLDCSHMVSKHLQELSGNSDLKQCFALCLQNLNWVYSQDMTDFFASSNLRNLHTLFIAYSSKFDDQVAESLVSSEVFQQLRSLGVSNCSRLSNEGFRTLINSPGFANISHLTLDMSNFSWNMDQAIQDIAASPYSKGLRTLSIATGHPVKQESWEALEKAYPNAKVTVEEAAGV